MSWSYTAPAGYEVAGKIISGVLRRYPKPAEGESVGTKTELGQHSSEDGLAGSATLAAPAVEDCPTPGVTYIYEVEGNFNVFFDFDDPATMEGMIAVVGPQVLASTLSYGPPTAATLTGTLSWTAPAQGPETGNEPVTGYYVQYRLDSGEWADAGHTGTEAEFSDINWRRYGAKLEFRVQVKTDFNAAAPLDDIWKTHTAFTRTANPQPKLEVTVYQPVVHRVATGFLPRQLEWQAPSGDVLGYQIHRRDASTMNAPFTLLATELTDTFFDDAEPAAGTAYEYRVQAYNLATGGTPLSDTVRLDFVGSPRAASSTTPPADAQIELSNFRGASFTSTGPSVLAPGSVHEFTVTRNAGVWSFGGDRYGLAFDAGNRNWARWIAPDEFGACVDVLFCVIQQASPGFRYHPADGASSRWLTYQRGDNISDGFGSVAMDSFRIYVPPEVHGTHSITFGFARIPESGSPSWLVNDNPQRNTYRSLEIRPVALVGPTAFSGTFASNDRLHLAWEALDGDYLGFRVQRRDASVTGQTYQSVCCNLAPNTRSVLEALPASGQPGASTTYEYRVGTYFDDGREVWFQKTLRVDVTGRTALIDSTPRFGASDQGRRFTLAAGTAATQLMPAATGGDAPLTYSVSGLSASQLQFDPAARELSGTPVLGTFAGTLHIRDANGDMDNLRFSVVVGSPPAKPTGLTAMADASAYQIDLDWTAPTDIGSGAITGYRIEHSPSGDVGSWLLLAGDTDPTATEWEHMNLRAGQEVHYRVAAINAAGVGAFSDDPASATAISAVTQPSPPTMLTATPGPDRVTLNWQAPASDGGAPIRGYCVQVAFRRYPTVDIATGKSSHREVLAAYLPASTLTYRHRDDLRSGIPLYYRVGAINSENDGIIILGGGINQRTCNERTRKATGAPEISPQATDFAVVRTIPGEPAAPSVPTNFAVTRGAYQLHLQWLPPDDDGGDPVAGYRIQHSTTGDRDSWNVLVAHTHSDRTEYIHAGLGRGTTGYYRVAAINTGGVGEFTNERFATTSNAPTPGPPNLEALRGAGVAGSADSITLNWQAPAASGDGAVSGYLLQTSTTGPGGPWGSNIAAGGADARTYEHAGLGPGERRYYRLAAQNPHGVGAWSRVASAETVASGGPRCSVVFVRHRFGGSRIQLTHTFPSEEHCRPIPAGGFLVVQHTYDRWAGEWHETTVFSTGAQIGAHNTVSDIHIPPTPPGGRLTLRMGYEDADERRGPWRLVESMRDVPLNRTRHTNSPPLAPVDLTAIRHDSAVELSWGVPFPGADPIEYYKLEHSTDATVTESTVWEGPLTLDRYLSRYVFSGMPNTQYHFRLAAGNAARGDGPWATVAAMTSAAVGTQPDPPYDLNATPASAGAIALTWRAPLLDHGVTVTAFRIEQSADGSADSWSTLHTTTDATARSHEHTGLTVGQRVFYQVFSVGAEESLPSRTVSAIAPGEAAGAPTELTAIGGRYANYLGWTAPAMTGGTPIRSYRIQYRDRRNAEWENLVAETGGQATGFIDRVALNGVARQYQVAAITVGRSGTYSTTVTATRSEDRPNPPTQVTAAVHGEDVEVQWLAPMHAGPGRRVTGYRVDRLRTGDSQWHTVASDTRTDRTNFLDRDVSLNSRYSYRVFALNRHDPGVSLVSAPSDAVHVVADWKLPPTTIWVEFGLHRNTIRWSRVDGGGGVTVNGYRIQHAAAADADAMGWTDLYTADSRYVQSYTHSGLQGPQSEYYYRIASVTSSGDSRHSIVVGGPVRDSVTFLDFNENDQVDQHDLRALYFGFAFRELLGDGNSGGFVDMRRALFGDGGVSGSGAAIGRPVSDAEFREYLVAANDIARGIDVAEFDVNGDGLVTDDDALILYYASELNTELGDGQTGGTVDFRRTFLRPFVVDSDPSDADLRLLLQRANTLLGN